MYKIPDNIQIPRNIRPLKKPTRLWVDNEILEVYGSKLKPHGIALYCALARHANSETQGGFPSYERLMKLSGIGKRNTISKYITIIEGLDLIKVIRNKKREPNIYFMLEVKIDSSQIDTTEKYQYTQKEKEQYLKGKVDSTERDTLNQLTNSYNKINNPFKKEEEGAKKSNVKDFKPDFLNNM